MLVLYHFLAWTVSDQVQISARFSLTSCHYINKLLMEPHHVLHIRTFYDSRVQDKAHHRVGSYPISSRLGILDPIPVNINHRPLLCPSHPSLDIPPPPTASPHKDKTKVELGVLLDNMVHMGEWGVRLGSVVQRGIGVSNLIVPGVKVRGIKVRVRHQDQQKEIKGTRGRGGTRSRQTPRHKRKRRYLISVTIRYTLAHTNLLSSVRRRNCCVFQ